MLFFQFIQEYVYFDRLKERQKQNQEEACDHQSLGGISELVISSDTVTGEYFLFLIGHTF